MLSLKAGSLYWHNHEYRKADIVFTLENSLAPRYGEVFFCLEKFSLNFGLSWKPPFLLRVRSVHKFVV